jgi:hypothetical protein
VHRRLTAALAAGCLLVALVAAPATAGASSRRATRAQTRAIFRAIDRHYHIRAGLSRCHPATPRLHPVGRSFYTVVTIASRACGNGQFALRRPRSGGRWQALGAGSDWGSPDRCARDIRVIGITALRELFGREICVNGFSGDFQTVIWLDAVVAATSGADPTTLANSLPQFDGNDDTSLPGKPVTGTQSFPVADGTAHTATVTLSFFVGSQADYAISVDGGAPQPGVITAAAVRALGYDPGPQD